MLNVRLALDDGAVDQLSVQAHVFHRRGQYPATNVEDVRRLDDGALETPGDFRQRGDKEIAERVPVKLGTCLIEAILKEAGHKRFVVGESDQAVANVARGGDVIRAANLAGAAAVVGDSDDSSE